MPSRPASPTDELATAAAPSKKQQRRASKADNDAYSREMAVVRQREKRRKRIRDRILLVSALVVGTAVVASAITYGVWRVGQDALAGPQNMLSDGLVLTGDGSTMTAWTTPALLAGEDPVATPANATAGVPALLTYLDFGDPDSATFWSTNVDNLTNWGVAGYLSLEVHAIAAADATSEGYSTRAARAFACTADLAPDAAMPVISTLFDAAPADGAAPTPGEVADLVESSIGGEVEGLRGCITSDRFAAWITASTERALAGPLPSDAGAALTSTPLVLADGVEFTGAADDSQGFADFLAAIYAAGADGVTTGEAGAGDTATG